MRSRRRRTGEWRSPSTNSPSQSNPEARPGLQHAAGWHNATDPLPTWADRRRTFERVATSLRPEGRFAWNAFAFDHRIAARLDGEHQQEPLPHTIRYAVGDNRIDIVRDDGARSSLWWATKNEWLGLLDIAGLQVEALYAGFAREPFTDDSREYVFVARRRLSSEGR